MKITRRQFIEAGGAAAAMAALGPVFAGGDDAMKKPNILWISCEDMSPHLGCYGVAEAKTPNLDRLAAQGARYTNAFTTAGVCAPSRSCIITGMYASSIGTHLMRCIVPPPGPVRCFTEWLREAGYYCSNNNKTDYNFADPPDGWDESGAKAHWRNRPEGAPFFSVFNLGVTHEGKIAANDAAHAKTIEKLDPALRHNPARMQLPPYYPDTPETRKRWAMYFDMISEMDREAGELLKQLEDDGLADNTIVFYWSDHGVGLPRAKRWIYEAGIHVPLIVRWPGKIEPGAVRDRMVSFIDLAPTVLALADIEKPAHMQGHDLLADDKSRKPRQRVFAARDRMDERYDIARCVRDSRWHYLRNFEPYRPYSQWINYLDEKPFAQEMRRLNDAGELKGPETLYFQKRKAVEELYDTQSDPHEIDNLAGKPEHEETLKRMRLEMERWMIATNDLGLVPEAILDAEREADPERAWIVEAWQAGAKEATRLEKPMLGRPADELDKALDDENRIVRLLAFKALGESAEKTEGHLIDALNHDDPAVRYWAAVHLGDRDGSNGKTSDRLTYALEDESPAVRIAAAFALHQAGRSDDALPVLTEALRDPIASVRLLALDALDRMDEAARPALEALFAARGDDFEYPVTPDHFHYTVSIARRAAEELGVRGKSGSGGSRRGGA